MRAIFDLLSNAKSKESGFSYLKRFRSKAYTANWITLLLVSTSSTLSLADPVQLDFSTLSVNQLHSFSDQIYVSCNRDSIFNCEVNGKSVGAVPGWYPSNFEVPSPSGSGQILNEYGFQMNISFLNDHPTFFSFDIANIFPSSQCVYTYPLRISATAVLPISSSSITIYPVTMDGQHFEFSHINGLSTVMIEVGCYAPLGTALSTDPIWLTNALVDFSNQVDLSVVQPLVSQPQASISQSDGLLHVKPGVPVDVEVPIKQLGASSSDLRTVKITLQAGSQPLQTKTINLSNIKSDGTTKVPFDVTFEPTESGIQTLTVTVNPDNSVPETYKLNNQSSVQVWVEGGYKIISQITNDDSSGEKSVSGSTPVNAQYPLGSEFTLQLQRLGTDGVTYQAVPATYKLAPATISPPVDPDSLFGSLAVIEYGGANVSPTSDSVTFQTLHLGQVPLQIIPSDGSPAVNVNLSVIKPDALGETHNEFDDLLIYEANQYGIPPDYLKGQVQHEGSFNPISYRYEPIGSISDLRSFSNQEVSAPDIQIEDSRGQDPYEHFLFETIDGRFHEGDQLLTADILPRLKLLMTTDPLWSPSSASTPDTRNITLNDRFVSVRQIYFANDSKQHWSNHAPSLLVIDINDHPEILDFTAQTAVAASYGLMQVMYSTATDDMGWEGRTSDHAKNPSYLYDTPDNLSDGGGSVAIGTGYDASLFFKVNDPKVIDRKQPYFASPNDFDKAYMRMFTCYNSCSPDKISASKYGSEVIQNAADYFEPISNKPIFP